MTSDTTAHKRSQRPLASPTQSGTVDVFRRSDLAAWGIDPSMARTYLRQGLWVRLHHGVYTDASIYRQCLDDPDRMHRLLIRAAVAALVVPAYAFGPSGSLVQGLPRPPGQPESVSIIRHTRADRRATRRRISRPSHLDNVHIYGYELLDADLTVVDGIPTVSRDLCAVSAAAMYSMEWAVVVLDAVSWQRPEAADALAALSDRWSRHRGIGTVRSALALARTGAQTPLESLSRVRFVGAGLPEPELQAAVYDVDGLVGFVDMLWRGLKVIGECDGLLKYDTREDVIREKLREDRLRALGYIVVRWTWAELMSNPAKVIAKIRRAFAEAAARH